MSQFESIHVVLKIAEVCNLGCKYCYFFEAGDDSYLSDPHYISRDTVESAAGFLAKGIDALNVATVDISLHGGEPLMVGKRRFEEICKVLNAYISPKARLNLVIQTNGTLLDDEWVRILSAYDVGIGISLDGPAEVNDVLRINKGGGGSHADVVKGISVLKRGIDNGLLRSFGVGCVIQPGSSAIETYRHLVGDLGLVAIDVRPPMMDWTNLDAETLRTVTTYYRELVAVWIKSNNPQVKIKFPSFALATMASDGGAVSGAKALKNRMRTFTIRSDGDLCPDDALVPKEIAYRKTGHNVRTSTLSDFFEASFWKQTENTLDGFDGECASCRWLGICRGGPAEERYLGNFKYSSKTVYCETRKAVYEDIYSLVSSAVGRQDVERRLEQARGREFW
jgi:uncharacterized protein